MKAKDYRDGKIGARIRETQERQKENPTYQNLHRAHHPPVVPRRRRPQVTMVLSGRGIEIRMTSADGAGLPTSHELRAMVRDLILMPEQWPSFPPPPSFSDRIEAVL